MAAAKGLNSAGLRSLEIFYEPVINCDFASVVAYRSTVRINNPEIGVILPDRYRAISERSAQCEKLSLWALDTVTDDIARLNGKEIMYDWLSMYVPIRLLTQKNFVKTVEAAIEEKKIPGKNLCLELPGEILFETPDDIKPIFSDLHDLNVRLALNEYGSYFSPLVRIRDFAFDYVVLDPTVTGSMTSIDESTVELAISIVDLARSNGAIPIASGVDSQSVADDFAGKCKLAVGKYAGKNKKITSIRS